MREKMTLIKQFEIACCYILILESVNHLQINYKAFLNSLLFKRHYKSEVCSFLFGLKR